MGVMLEMQSISKHFGAVVALEKVNFSLEKGEVHALVGENGAGKSTLMKILAGVQRPTSGKLKLNGEEVSFGSVSEAQSHGVAMVYQELALVPHLSVAENLFFRTALALRAPQRDAQAGETSFGRGRAKCGPGGVREFLERR